MAEDISDSKEKIIKNLESSKEQYLGVKEEASKVMGGVEEIEKNADLMIYRIDKSLKIFRSIPDEAFQDPDQAFKTMVGSGSFVSDQMYGHSVRLRASFHEFAEKMPLGTSMIGDTTSSDVHIIAFETGSIIQPVYSEDVELRGALEEARLPSPIEEREELGAKLKAIQHRLYEKFEGMWQTLTDTTKKDRYRQAAHSMREVMSDFLQILAPDEEVEKTKWWKPETGNKKPTQRQRAKYAMIGMKEEAALPEEDIELVDELMNDARKRYEDLNEIAHARSEESEELFHLLESYIATCQKIINDILELRARYFSEVSPS